MKIALITGASRGIGAATALECARRGFGVILTYKQQGEQADTLVRRIREQGGSAAALEFDAGQSTSYAAFASQVGLTLRQHWGVDRLAALVNNAGYGFFKPVAQLSEAEFDGLLNVHLKAPFFLTQQLLPLLADGASIVNLTSATTRVATIGVAAYASCKGALEVLTRYMAKEFGERRIRVNSVSPGAIRTELGGGLNAEFEALLADQTALGRVGETLDVARVIAMLLTEDGQWINAQNIEVAGGYAI